MIKCIILDLDGVLVSTKDTHYNALNKALKEIHSKYEISYDEHVRYFDGNPTRVKLNILTKDRGLDPALHDKINTSKQKYTHEILSKSIQEDLKFIDIFRYLSSKKNIKLWVASNSIKKTVEIIVKQLGIEKYVSGIVSNEDVKKSKPHPEMYLKCMSEENIGPRETIVIEDSYVGRKGAYNSGAHLLAVKNPQEVTLGTILDRIDHIQCSTESVQVWEGQNMNIVIPMAGKGERFKSKYTFPKPLIDIKGKPMIQVIVENLNMTGRYTFIVQKEHYETYNLSYVLNLIAPNCSIIQIDHITQGAACTVLLAKEIINNNEQLIIANSDQLVEWDSSSFMYEMQKTMIDGGMATFTNKHSKWSYAKLDDSGYVCEVAEKRPISTNATCIRGSSIIKTDKGLKRISIIVNNKIRCKVLSYNTLTNTLEYKQVKGWVKNVNSKDWYELYYKNITRNRRLYVTEDHIIYTNNGNKKVNKLNTSTDKVLTKFKDLSVKQLEIFNGSMLGDSSIKHTDRTLSFSHSIKQKEWFKLKLNALKNFNPFSYEYESSNLQNLQKYKAIACRFKKSPIWNTKRSEWYINGKKIVPSGIELTPLTLATWYMDDGTLVRNKIPKMSVNAFEEKYVNILMNKFTKIGIGSYKYYDNGFRLCINAACAHAFFDAIHKYIPPTMQYKLPEIFKNKYDKELWNIKDNIPYYESIVLRKLDKNYINNNKHSFKYSYCLEIEENHNFVIADMVISNCGIYFYKKGSDFVKYAEQMIKNEATFNNEYYVAPVYNEAIKDNKNIVIHDVEKMWGLGTPEDLTYFLDNYNKETV